MTSSRRPGERLLAVVAVAAVVLTAGFVVGFRIVLNRLDGAIPQTDLFGSATPEGEPSPTGPPPGADITGPLNFLIAGHDQVLSVSYRQAPHADAVMILHIDASLTHAYLVSLPRDLLVGIPADPASGTSAHSRQKLTNAMTYGAHVPATGRYDNLPGGFALLARTVSAYTGIDHFDGGAVLSFDGLSQLVDAVGGVDLYVDTEVTSIHRRPDGAQAEGQKGGEWQEYPVGMFHFNGWQALDYARQRYSLPDGAYGRERHQRQMIRALVDKLSGLDLLHNPLKAPAVLTALGETVTLDLRGRTISEYVYALRNLRSDAITLVGLPGGAVMGSSGYLGEELAPIQRDYFTAVRDDRVAEFLAANPTLVNNFSEPAPTESTASPA